MKRIDNDTFYDYIRQYDQDSEYHLVGEVDYHLISDEKPYEGPESPQDKGVLIRTTLFLL